MVKYIRKLIMFLINQTLVPLWDFTQEYEKATNDFNNDLNSNKYTKANINELIEKEYDSASKLLAPDFSINFYENFLLKNPKRVLKYKYEDI